MFGVMRIVNLAHGVLAVAAAYVALDLLQRADVSPFLTLLVVVPVFAAVGYALQRGLFNPALAHGELSPLLVSFGLAVILTNLCRSATPRTHAASRSATSARRASASPTGCPSVSSR
jgi:branched-chain amino acid transport system permease protein